MIQAKHGNIHNQREFKCSSRESWLWRDVAKHSHLISDHLTWAVGQGTSISLRNPYWFQSVGPLPQGLSTVSDLLVHNHLSWDRMRLQILYLRQVIDQILKIPIAHSLIPDQICWNGVVGGTYSMKVGFQKLMQNWNRQNSLPGKDFFFSPGNICGSSKCPRNQ